MAMRSDALEAGDKSALRAGILAARARVHDDEWRLEDAVRLRHIVSHLPLTPGTVALYASRPGEPGTDDLIDAFATLGWRILLPVLRRRVDWAEFDSWDAMTPSWGDIPEPTGLRLGEAALATADLILVPCLAVGRDGSRLGTGGGWYDRALPHRRVGARIVAIARGREVVGSVPTLPHDVSVDAFVTEAGWVDL